MKLENQVCTIEQGQKLQGLGLCVRPTFEFCERGGKPSIRFANGVDTDDFKLTYWVYTVAELGVMLEEASEGAQFTDFGDWVTHWDNVHVQRFPTEAQCRADLLIYLIESGQSTVFEANQRLSNS